MDHSPRASAASSKTSTEWVDSVQTACDLTGSLQHSHDLADTWSSEEDEAEEPGSGDPDSEAHDVGASDTESPDSSSDGPDSIRYVGEPPDLTGAIIGHTYKLRKRLGGGAMGDVWLAEDGKLGRQVAVKLVHFDKLAPTDARRLRQEARLTARIQHSNVVTVFDTGIQDRTFYLAMELLQGEDLATVLTRRGSFTQTEAVQMMLPVLGGLVATHAREVVHRDIKPENIFLEERDGKCVPKVVDFGVALARDMPATLRLTKAGLLVGTPLYMAPEQFVGNPNLDERVDVWSVATMLFELIAGVTPVPYELGMTELIGRIASPAPLLVDERVPDPALRAIIQRGLQKNPEQRWSSARHMGTALAHWLMERGVHQDISGESLTSNWLRDSSPSIAIHSETRQSRITELAWRGREWMGTGSNKKKLLLAAALGLMVGGQAAAKKLDGAEAAERQRRFLVVPPQTLHTNDTAELPNARKGAPESIARPPERQGSRSNDGSAKPPSSPTSSATGPTAQPGSQKNGRSPNSQTTPLDGDIDPRWGF